MRRSRVLWRGYSFGPARSLGCSANSTMGGRSNSRTEKRSTASRRRGSLLASPPVRSRPAISRLPELAPRPLEVREELGVGVLGNQYPGGLHHGGDTPLLLLHGDAVGLPGGADPAPRLHDLQDLPDVFGDDPAGGHEVPRHQGQDEVGVHHRVDVLLGEPGLGLPDLADPLFGDGPGQADGVGDVEADVVADGGEGGDVPGGPPLAEVPHPAGELRIGHPPRVTGVDQGADLLAPGVAGLVGPAHVAGAAPPLPLGLFAEGVPHPAGDPGPAVDGDDPVTHTGEMCRNGARHTPWSTGTSAVTVCGQFGTQMLTLRPVSYSGSSLALLRGGQQRSWFEAPAPPSRSST